MKIHYIYYKYIYSNLYRKEENESWVNKRNGIERKKLLCSFQRERKKMGQYSNRRGRGGNIQKFPIFFLGVRFSSRSDVPLSPVQFRQRGCLLRLLVGIVNMTNHFSGERMMKSGGLEFCKKQCIQWDSWFLFFHFFL